MKIVGKIMIEKFKGKHAEVSSQIDAWYAEVSSADWVKPLDIKQRYSTASILPNDYVVFNLKGNKYRLLVQVNYKNKIVLIKKIGTHSEYINWSK